MNFLFNFGLVNAPVIAAFLSAYIPLRFLGIRALLNLLTKVIEAFDEDEGGVETKTTIINDIDLTMRVQNYLSEQTDHIVKAGTLLFIFGLLCNVGMFICAFCNVKDSLLMDCVRMILIPFCSFILYAYNTLKIYRMRNFVIDLGKSIFPSLRTNDVCKDIPLQEMSLLLLMGLAAFLLLMVALCFKFIVKYNLPLF